MMELLRNIENYPINVKLSMQKTQNVSREALDFMQGCLQFEESKRLGWKQVYLHELFEGCFTSQLKKIEKNQVKIETCIKTPNQERSSVPSKHLGLNADPYAK